MKWNENEEREKKTETNMECAIGRTVSHSATPTSNKSNQIIITTIILIIIIFIIFLYIDVALHKPHTAQWRICVLIYSIFRKIKAKNFSIICMFFLWFLLCTRIFLFISYCQYTYICSIHSIHIRYLCSKNKDQLIFFFLLCVCAECWELRSKLEMSMLNEYIWI